MRRRLAPIGILFAGAISLLAWPSRADTPDQRYKAIPQRNLFGLKAAQPPKIDTPQSPTLPRLILSGITTILGNKRALLKAQPPGARPGDVGKEDSFILTEGQREGYVEVVEINEGAGAVTVRNSGTLMTLTFEKDGPKLPAGQATATPPAAVTPPPTPGIPALPNSQPANTENAALNPANPSLTPGMRRIPTRYRTPDGTLPTAASNGVGQAVNPPNPYGVSIPNAGAATLPENTVPVQGQQTLTAEEQAALLEVQRQMNQQNNNNNNNSSPPPLPSTGRGPAGVYPNNVPPANALVPARPPLTPILPQ